MDWIFIGIVALVALSAVANWRSALYACIIIDFARDPIRKLTTQQSAICTVVVGIVWFMALVGAGSLEARELKKLFVRYPRLRWSILALATAILPGALVSLIRYQNGYVLVAIGSISYLAPFIGVALGYLWPRRAEDILRWLTVYALLNSVALIGAVIEFMGGEIPGLGGMKMEWVRNYGEDTVELICGFYRSPDVMGLHAAHVLMFAAILALRPHARFSTAWWSLCTWAALCLVLSGRRKMIAVPIVFFATYALFNYLSGRRGRQTAIAMIVFASCIAAGLYGIGQFDDHSTEYTRYMSSIVKEGVERVSKSFGSIVHVTIAQSGWLGDGLGSATQGKQYTGINVGKSWQEDGVGRLFKELGVPGVVLSVFALVYLIQSGQSSLEATPTNALMARHLQFGLASVVAGNATSFVVSHQAYSGDPSTVLIVGFCFGMVLGMPRIARAART